MARVHAVFSQKGGVGKTTLAVNLAAVTADVLGSKPSNPSVLVASIDPQASAVWWAERIDENRLAFDFVQADDAPETISKLASEPYEHVFIDAPGSVARPVVLTKALDVADDVIVPVIPESLAYEPTLRSVRDFIEPRSLSYRVVRNNWDRRDGRIDIDLLTQWLEDNGLKYTNTIVRRYKMHSTAAGEGRVVTQYPSGRTATEARSDFLALALELGYGGRI